MVTTHDIFLNYVLRNHRDRILLRLKKLKTLKSKKRFISVIRQPRHAAYTLSKYSDISFAQFKLIINEMNNRVCDEVVNDKILILSPKLGHLRIRIDNRHITLKEGSKLHTGVDHNATRELKKQIISEGKIPFEVIRDEKGKIVGNNGGVEWLVYHTQPIVACWSWFKKSFDPLGKQLYQLQNLSCYHFKVSFDNKKKLNKMMVENFN